MDKGTMTTEINPSILKYLPRLIYNSSKFLGIKEVQNIRGINIHIKYLWLLVLNILHKIFPAPK